MSMESLSVDFKTVALENEKVENRQKETLFRLFRMVCLSTLQSTGQNQRIFKARVV